MLYVVQIIYLSKFADYIEVITVAKLISQKKTKRFKCMFYSYFNYFDHFFPDILVVKYPRLCLSLNYLSNCYVVMKLVTKLRSHFNE